MAKTHNYQIDVSAPLAAAQLVAFHPPGWDVIGTIVDNGVFGCLCLTPCKALWRITNKKFYELDQRAAVIELRRVEDAVGPLVINTRGRYRLAKK